MLSSASSVLWLLVLLWWGLVVPPIMMGRWRRSNMRGGLVVPHVVHRHAFGPGPGLVHSPAALIRLKGLVS